MLVPLSGRPKITVRLMQHISCVRMYTVWANINAAIHKCGLEIKTINSCVFQLQIYLPIVLSEGFHNSRDQTKEWLNLSLDSVEFFILTLTSAFRCASVVVVFPAVTSC